MKDKIIMPSKISEEIEERKTILEQLIAAKEKSLASAPEGILHAVSRGSYYEYYRRKDSSVTTGEFLKSKNQRLIQRLGQKKYDEKFIQAAQAELKILKKLGARLEKLPPLEDIYSNASPALKAIAEPDAMSDEDFKQMWIEKYESLPKKDTSDLTSELYTDKGEHVRSKSEINIGNALLKNDIPYVYEAELRLRNGKIIHPDFTALNLRARQTFYWEHNGKMDDESYLLGFMDRMKWYRESDIYPGINQILSFETLTNQISTLAIQQIIDKYLK